jgi:hypothetical protein
MFGSSKKKSPNPPAQTPQEKAAMEKERQKFDQARTSDNLHTTIANFNQKIDGCENEIKNLDLQIREQLKVGNKTKAKQMLTKKKAKEGMLTTLRGQVNHLEKQEIQVDNMVDQSEFANVIKDANKIVGKNVAAQDDLREQLELARELDAEMKMTQEQMQGMYGDDDDSDLDEELALEMEMMGMEDNQFNDMSKVPVNQHANVAPAMGQKKKGADDLFDDLMNI